jgi:hypothetical protein
MVRKTAIKQLNGFSRKLKLGEDWVFWIELATLGRFVYLPMPVLCLYRQHPQSAARNMAVNNQEMLPAINHAFDIQAVIKNYSAGYLAKLKKQTLANSLCYSAQELLKQQQWKAAKTLYANSLKLRPLHLRTLILYFCSSIEFIPQFIRIKLK